MENKNKSTLTTFNFQIPEDVADDEGVLAKIFDKVISAVSGQHTQDNCSIRTQQAKLQRAESVTSITTQIEQQQSLGSSSLSRHLTTASSSTTDSSNKELALNNFPAAMHLDAVPRSSTSTTATTTTTVTVGNQKSEQKISEEDHNAHINATTVQFVTPSIERPHDDSHASLDFLMTSPLTKRKSMDSDTQSVATNFSISNSNSLSKILARLRGQKSDKEFWMPDEQCKECYKCRKPFTLLRRKHHCRTCGQIFCGRCASHVLSGKNYKQKGQFRVCNFCYAEQLQQLKENLTDNPETHEYSASTQQSTNSGIDRDPQQQQNQPSGTYNSTVIPSQKPPLAVPKMQIPATALRHTRSNYGNDDTTMFALEIPTHGSDNYMSGSPQTSFLLERPNSSNALHTLDPSNNTTDSASLSHNIASYSSGRIPTITTTSASSNEHTAGGGLKRLLDAGTSLLKSTTSSRPRSNTSSSAPLEDTRYSGLNQYGSSSNFRGYNHPFTPYLLDRGGGTVLAESELSPFPGNNDHETEFYHDHLHHHTHYDSRLSQIPAATTPPPPPPPPPPPLPILSHQSNFGNTALKVSTGDHLYVNQLPIVGSDDESYDHRLRVKRTEELRGKNLLSLTSSILPRRLSFTGNIGNIGNSNKRVFRNNMIRVNTAGLPKSEYSNPQQFNENWSPGQSSISYSDSFQQSQLQMQHQQQQQQQDSPISPNMSMGRRRLPPRPRKNSIPPQTVELSLSARNHARKILRQLMEDITLEETSQNEWEEVIMNILLKVANSVQPDIRSGDDMDIRHYVKIKKIPGGAPSDSFYVKGVVCTKNVAHKRMMKNILKPRILILMFSLDYSRVEMENQLAPIAPVISQEREHVRQLIGRIVALKPSLLVVKSTVSRLALEFLLAANIPVVHNVKDSVIEAIARCTQASVVNSVDKLKQELSFGHCGSFEIRTYMHEWIPNRRKSFLFFDDCAPELGGTIVLRGEKDETLCVIKRLIDFMVFVVNNLKLETSLLLDSFAKSPGTVDTATGTSHISERHRSPLISNINTLQTRVNQSGESTHSIVNVDYEEEDGHTIHSHYTADLLKLYQNTVLSVSPFVVFPPPYLLVTLKETEDKLALINDQKRRKSISGSSIITNATTTKDSIAPFSASPTRSTVERQSIYSVDHSTVVARNESADHHRHQNWRDEDVVLVAENDLLTRYRQISRAWDAYISKNPEFISPFYHQNIVVLYSTVCSVTTVPCQGPEIRIFSFYRYPSDKPLGQYVMDFCNDARQPCSSLMCDHPMIQHYRSYAHGNARVNIMIEPFPCPLPGMENKLLMWSYCKECNKPTPAVPVSNNTWNYSFGKFLEIFFYQQGVYCRADICPHDMARNHIRYFGYMNLTVRFQHDPIELLEVIVPPMKLFIFSQVQMDIKDSELALLRSKINKFYQSIIERNKAFPFDLVDPHKLDQCKAELQEMSLEAQGEKKDALQLVQTVYARSDPYDTLSINSVRRNLFQVVHHWYAVYTDFVRYYLQPERELKKITTNQLRKMFPGEISEATIFKMDNERTKRATEVTDLPLLGIGLDGEQDDDALIGHILRRKSGVVKVDEDNHRIIFPILSCSPLEEKYQETNTDSDTSLSNDSTLRIDKDHKNSFLRPEVRRRLSIDLLHELDAKFKVDEGKSTGIESLNRIASNKFLRIKSPATLSAAFTPSRIPIPQYSGNGRGNILSTPPLYEPFNIRQRSKITSFLGSTLASPHLDSHYLSHLYKTRKGKHSDRMDSSTSTDPLSHIESTVPRSSTSATLHSKSLHHRHHSIGHSQHLNQKHVLGQLRTRRNENREEDDDEEDDHLTPSSFLRKSATTRRFRSRLPRKKTHIQVYTQANDLAREDLDDEFYASGDQPDDTYSIESLSKPKKHQNRAKNPNHACPVNLKQRMFPASGDFHDNGEEADNDDNDISDDAGDESDREHIDYFSSLAPYTHDVIEGASAVLAANNGKDVMESQSVPKNLGDSLKQRDYFAKTYFPFSDGQLDMSSGLSGEEGNDRDLPSATELLMDQQANADVMTLGDLHNIHPGMLVDNAQSNNGYHARVAVAEAIEEGRHSPEKTSFMKTLTNFLTDSGLGNLLPLESPLLPTEYLFPDSHVVVREDEPSTIIAYTLDSKDYIEKLQDIREYSSGDGSNEGTIRPGDASLMDAKAPSEVTTVDNGGPPQLSAEDIQETLLRESGTHMRYNFSTGNTKFFCKIFFSEQFDALRKNCGFDESYIMSLASCIKWDSSGGKSGSAFLKTKDDRLLMKQMSKYELDAFLGFAPAYFQYMSEAFFSELPTVLAKIFGFYSIGYKNSATGKSMRMDVLVMENLFYQRNVKKIFDLKGSMRNRHVQSTGKQDEVLLDENLVELIYQSPLFIRSHSKEILRSSLHNDTLFLSNRDVMDYSLLVGIDEERQELVVGIVDFIRTFTWDKKLESWVKESGILGGGGKGPTIVSPRQYRIRFREAMKRYFLMVPDYWALTRQRQSSYVALHHHHANQSESDGD